MFKDDIQSAQAGPASTDQVILATAGTPGFYILATAGTPGFYIQGVYFLERKSPYLENNFSLWS